jgi:nucleotide-binding universal stress UspA family protein
MKNILVTLDLNNDEGLLINMAVQLAVCFDSKIWLMHIAAPDPDFVGYRVGPQYVRDTRAEELRKEHRLLQENVVEINKHGVDAEGLLVQGSTVEMIIEESKKLKVDLIIAGHQKHGFFYKALLENISAKIIKKSKIPVLIVPLD